MQKRDVDPDAAWDRPQEQPRRSAWAEGLRALGQLLGLLARLTWFVMVVLLYCAIFFGALVAGLLRGVRHTR